MFFLLILSGIQSEGVKSGRILCSKRVPYVLIYLMGGSGFNRVVKLVLQHEIKRFDENLLSVVYITDVNYIESKLYIVAYVLCTVLIGCDCSVMPLVKGKPVVKLQNVMCFSHLTTVLLKYAEIKNIGYGKLNDEIQMM